MVDITVSVRQETGALVAGVLALSGTHTHTAVHPVRLSKLQGRAGLVFEDVLARVEEVRFAFPGWPQEAFAVCFVENGDASAPASYEPVAGNLVDFQTLVQGCFWLCSGHSHKVLDECLEDVVASITCLFARRMSSERRGEIIPIKAGDKACQV